MADRTEYKRRYRAQHVEEIRAYQAAYDRKRVRTPDARKREWLKARYGLTVGQVLEMAEAQNFTCPLCLRVFGESENLRKLNGNQLVIDHDHDTEEVRGLLCRACNILLGRFGDKTENIETFLTRVRAYLEK